MADTHAQVGTTGHKRGNRTFTVTSMEVAEKSPSLELVCVGRSLRSALLSVSNESTDFR